MSDKRFAGKIALVTGASRGIGRAAAIALGREGAHVICVARTVGGLEETDDAIQKAGGTDTEKLIGAMEGMEFDTPKGKMVFRKDDHQALQVMYHFKVKASGKDEYDLLDLVREIPIAELPVPVRNKR